MHGHLCRAPRAEHCRCVGSPDRGRARPAHNASARSCATKLAARTPVRGALDGLPRLAGAREPPFTRLSLTRAASPTCYATPHVMLPSGNKVVQSQFRTCINGPSTSGRHLLQTETEVDLIDCLPGGAAFAEDVVAAVNTADEVCAAAESVQDRTPKAWSRSTNTRLAPPSPSRTRAACRATGLPVRRPCQR